MALLASYIVCSLSSLLGGFEQYTTFCFNFGRQESELDMLNMRERTDVLFKRFSRLSLLRLVGKVILGLLTVQVLTVAVLLVIAALGKRRKHEVSFPHAPFEEVQVGENVLQLFSYGRDLYDWITHSYFTDCLQAGIRIFGYRYTMLHAKTCTIDGAWSTVGTCNLDRLSLVGNYEINVAVYSAAFAQQLSALFAEDTAERFELTMEQWKRRPWYNKVSERILAPLRFMM